MQLFPKAQTLVFEHLHKAVESPIIIHHARLLKELGLSSSFTPKEDDLEVLKRLRFHVMLPVPQPDTGQEVIENYVSRPDHRVDHLFFHKWTPQDFMKLPEVEGDFDLNGGHCLRVPADEQHLASIQGKFLLLPLGTPDYY